MRTRPSTFRLTDHGFTLIEIMVAIAILAGLSLLTAQAIQNGALSRDRINREINADAELRDTLRVVERDINLAFHHRDIFTSMLNQIDKDRATAATKKATEKKPGDTTTPPPGPDAGSADGSSTTPVDPYPPLNERKPPKNLTAFMGDAQSLHFTSLSNVRLQRDVQESEQAEIGYFLRSCRSRQPGPGKEKSSSSQCLIRRVSPLLDDDVTQGGNEVVILEHVKEFKLRYFGPGRDDWVETWKTGDGGDAISKENFPYAVEVSVVIWDDKNPKARKTAMTMVAPLNFPNNPPKKKEETDGTTTARPGG